MDKRRDGQSLPRRAECGAAPEGAGRWCAGPRTLSSMTEAPGSECRGHPQAVGLAQPVLTGLLPPSLGAWLGCDSCKHPRDSTLAHRQGCLHTLHCDGPAQQQGSQRGQPRHAAHPGGTCGLPACSPGDWRLLPVMSG